MLNQKAQCNAQNTVSSGRLLASYSRHGDAVYRAGFHLLNRPFFSSKGSTQFQWKSGGQPLFRFYRDLRAIVSNLWIG
jgi:hypothetical protein